MSALIVIFEIFGSLGLFLFGMKVMSEAIQKVAGERLRTIMSRMTTNRFYGLLTGLFVTSLVQSSSATTVMVVSFVNAGLLRLKQAIGVIMGANLGTTVTFWIVAFIGFKFSLSNIALPIVGIGLPMLFMKNARTRDTGEAFIGFGLLFMGLSLLKDSVPDVRNNPEVLDFVQHFSGLGYPSVLLFFFFGVCLTILVQSSSVAGAIVLALASKGWIDFPTAAAVVLGENVGTTVTAIIASLGANVHAKRAALAHLCFNLIGVVWMLIVFPGFVYLVDTIMPGDAADPAVIPEHLALFHTLFNFSNICLLIWFVPQISLLVQKLLPQKETAKKRDETYIPYLSDNFIHTGELNLAEAQLEVSRMAAMTEDMFRGFLEVFDNPDKDMSEKVKELKGKEEVSDQFDLNLTEYLVRCSTDRLSARSTEQVTALMRVVTELEDICDYCYKLVLLAQRKYRKQRMLPTATRDEIRSYSEQVLEFIRLYRYYLDKPVTDADMKKASKLERSIGHSLKKLRKDAVKRIQETGDVKAEMLYIDILNQFDKIGNHAYNIFEALHHQDLVD